MTRVGCIVNKKVIVKGTGRENPEKGPLVAIRDTGISRIPLYLNPAPRENIQICAELFAFICTRAVYK